jgi:hypothetical protein
VQPTMTSVSCKSCVYNQGKCDIYGIQTSPLVLCRMYLTDPEQSHEDALKRWPILETLEPGIIYTYGGDPSAPGEPKPLYAGLQRKPRTGHGA